jgi:hypothetical protein
VVSQWLQFERGLRSRVEHLTVSAVLTVANAVDAVQSVVSGRRVPGVVAPLAVANDE